MIDKEHLKKDIEISLVNLKSSLNNNRIKFSRIEKYFSANKLQWLLSIVLDEAYGNEEVDEIVIEINIITQEYFLMLNADLSLGNGFILKEKSKKIDIYAENENKIIYDLKDTFLNNINNEIDQAIINLG